jgi:hypothetical protein
MAPYFRFGGDPPTSNPFWKGTASALSQANFESVLKGHGFSCAANQLETVLKGHRFSPAANQLRIRFERAWLQPCRKPSNLFWKSTASALPQTNFESVLKEHGFSRGRKPTSSVLKGHGFSPAANLRICFERARLQPCRKHRRKRAGFSPWGMPSAAGGHTDLCPHETRWRREAQARISQARLSAREQPALASPDAGRSHKSQSSVMAFTAIAPHLHHTHPAAFRAGKHCAHSTRTFAGPRDTRQSLTEG